MARRSVYDWIDPEDALWLPILKEALAIERRAWELADAERRQLRARLALLEAGLPPERANP